jgi:hypothetical protein
MTSVAGQRRDGECQPEEEEEEGAGEGGRAREEGFTLSRRTCLLGREGNATRCLAQWRVTNRMTSASASVWAAAVRRTACLRDRAHVLWCKPEQ